MEIELLNVKYMYSNSDKDVIKNINEKICKESISSIIGSGAAGKSTFASLIGGTLIPTSGEIIVDKQNTMDYDEIKFKVGFLHQNFSEQIKGETVKDAIEYYLKSYNYKHENIDKHVKDALKMVGLDTKYLNRKINILSQSELKKIALASVLALNPRIIILDEVTSHLDNNSKNNLIKIIRILKNRFHKTKFLQEMINENAY